MGGIIVVADTHFGIKKDNSISMPGYFADFLQWVKQLEIEGKKSVKILDKETIKEKTLVKPEKLIFLGDIIELWDSEDEAVNTCVTLLVPTLTDISAEKIYVLGNHDNILDRAILPNAKEYYPLGDSHLKIVDDTYPAKEPIPLGDQNYLFVHGHQFSPSKLFSIALKIDKIVYHLSLHKLNIRMYDIIPSLKKIRNTMGTASWIFIILFSLGLIPYLLNLVSMCGISNSIISWIWKYRVNFRLLLLFGLLSLPNLVVDYGRPIHDRLSGKLRYEKEKTIEKFIEWWEDKKSDINQKITIIYGHTHILNYVNLQEEEYEKKFKKRPDLYDFYLAKLRKRNITENRPTLVNASSWMKDTKNKIEDEKYKNVMVASFLYIDETGYEFFGWDWYKNQIFHIPKEVIIIRREPENNVISEETAALLSKIGWPKKLIEKWKKPIKI